MSDPNTLRILEIDGGGERGYLPLSFLLLFLQLWGIDPKSIYKQFDVICGTSIGGILALALAMGKDPNDLTSFFTEKGPYVFSTSSSTPSSRPSLAKKVLKIFADDPFYSSSNNKYGYGLLVATLQSLFGNSTLQDVKTNVIIPSYEDDTDTYVTFSNLNYPDFIGQNELVINAALATGSAPVYFPALNINGHEYIDGGVYNNNPASIGRAMAQAIKPTATRTCILSLGTGIGEKGFDPGKPSLAEPKEHAQLIATLNALQTTHNLKLFDSLAQIFGLFDIASVGSQESTSFALSLEARYTINQLYYYRFQPNLDKNVNTELDNTDSEILTYYQNTARQWYNNDIKSISEFLGHLIA